MNQNNMLTSDKNNSNEDTNNNSFPIIVSNSYIKKYYLDERLDVLPKEVKNKIKELFVTMTEEYGGMAIAYYNNLTFDISFEIKCNAEDFNFDEIGANYKLSKIEKEYEEIFNQIASFCKFKFNGLI